jgi:hypothetical protein
MGGGDLRSRRAHRRFETGLFAKRAAQDGIDEAAGASREGHRLVDGGVGRRAQMKNLVEAEPENRARVRIHSGLRAIARSGNPSGSGSAGSRKRSP